MLDSSRASLVRGRLLHMMRGQQCVQLPPQTATGLPVATTVLGLMVSSVRHEKLARPCFPQLPPPAPEPLLAVQAGILLMLLHQQPVNTDQSSFSPSCKLLPADRQRLQRYVPSIAARLADAARQAF